MKKLIEEEGVGERDGGRGVGYVEVEMDAPENGELGMRYLVYYFSFLPFFFSLFFLKIILAMITGHSL